MPPLHHRLYRENFNAHLETLYGLLLLASW